MGDTSPACCQCVCRRGVLCAAVGCLWCVCLPCACSRRTLDCPLCHDCRRVRVLVCRVLRLYSRSPYSTTAAPAVTWQDAGRQESHRPEIASKGNSARRTNEGVYSPGRRFGLVAARDERSGSCLVQECDGDAERLVPHPSREGGHALPRDRRRDPAVLQVRMKRANSAGVRPSRHGFRRQPNASLATPPRLEDGVATTGGDARARAVATLAVGNPQHNAFQPARQKGFTTPGEAELILGRPAPMQSSQVYD